MRRLQVKYALSNSIFGPSFTTSVPPSGPLAGQVIAADRLLDKENDWRGGEGEEEEDDEEDGEGAGEEEEGEKFHWLHPHRQFDCLSLELAVGLEERQGL